MLPTTLKSYAERRTELEIVIWHVLGGFAVVQVEQTHIQRDVLPDSVAQVRFDSSAMLAEVFNLGKVLGLFCEREPLVQTLGDILFQPEIKLLSGAVDPGTVLLLVVCT